MMAEMPEDTLATLSWLVEAGADEAIAGAPVNRLVMRATIASPSRGKAVLRLVTRRTGRGNERFPLPQAL